MSDVSQTDEYQEDPSQGQEQPDLRNLREKAKKADAAEAENQRLKSELALAQSGITGLDEAKTKALLLTHDGDVTPEALRKTAEGLGFYTPPPEVDPEVQAAQEQVSAASRGATAGNTTPGIVDWSQANSVKEMEELARANGVAWDNSSI